MHERVQSYRHLLLGFLLSVIFLFPITLLAAEGCESQANTIFRFSKAPDGQLAVPFDLPVNGVISSMTVPARFDAGPDCSAAGVVSLLFSRTDNSGTKDYQKIFPTTVAGLGIRIALRDIQSSIKTAPSIAGIGERFMLAQSGASSAFLEGNLRVELIKTAAQIENRETKEEMFRFEFQDRAGSPISSTKFSLAKLRIATVGCQLKAKSVSVPMGNVSVKLITNANSGNPGTKFTISLACFAGTRAFITATDMTSPNNQTDILSLTKSSTAKGVGIRVSDSENKAISYGPDGKILVAGSSQGGEVSVLLTARYVPTASSAITPGSADAIATFTLAYQ